MTKEVKQIVILGVLIIALVFVTLNNLKKKPDQKKPALSSPNIVSINKSPASETSSNRAAPTDDKTMSVQKQRANLTWGRDPFNTASDKDYEMTDLKLKGISFAKNKEGYAFINDDIVKKGNKIGDYEVIEVEKDKVLLKKGAQSFYLTFPKE